MPGSHSTPITRRFMRTGQVGTKQHLEFKGQDKVFPDDAWVAAPVKKGSVVLIHGQVYFSKKLDVILKYNLLRLFTNLRRIHQKNLGMRTPSMLLRWRDHTMPLKTGFNPQKRCLFQNCTHHQGKLETLLFSNAYLAKLQEI